MAAQNLPSFPDAPAIRISTSRRLHFRAGFDSRRGLIYMVCESQPLFTVTTLGLPKRCPLCGADTPLGRKSKSPKENS